MIYIMNVFKLFYSKSRETKLNIFKCKKKFLFNPSIEFFFIESYKEYNQIECKYKNDKLKDLINLKAFIRNLVK